MKKKRAATSYRQLVQSYYGGPGEGFIADATRYANLFATYYGKPEKAPAATSLVLSVRADDGEQLKQKRSRAAGQSTFGRPREYVVAHSCGGAAGPAWRGAPAAISRTASYQRAAPAEPQAGIDHEALAREECQVDLRDPLGPPAQPAPIPRQSVREAQPPALPPLPPAPQYPVPGAESQAASTDDDFLTDMKAILSGQKSYDPTRKTVVDKSGDPESRPGPGAAGPAAKSEHDIFNRIAESMQYANAYDLGTVELNNRFEEFERASQKRHAADSKPAGEHNGPLRPAASAPPRTEEFIHDLDAIEALRGVRSSPPLAPAQGARNRPYSRPMFDAGEHVLPGEALYPGKLRVGKDRNVTFSYGQIIAMGDLFDSVDDMMKADTKELTKLKQLIDRSTSHYRKGRGANVTDKEWQDSTADRYLKLAEDNYDHFAADSLISTNAGTRGNNKARWEQHHRRAIEEAQKLGAPARGAILEWPLIINAFGDHWLTDAFAAGHLINKEAMIGEFKARFYGGAALNPAGQKFFEDVATAAYQGEVEKKFSRLEVVEPVMGTHPDISSAWIFGRVLIGIAEEAPDRVANLAVDALHDRLNKDGVEVTNQAGGPGAPWTAVGDGHLQSHFKTLAEMTKAVQQSVDNVNSAAAAAAITNFQPYFDQVWKFVPEMTPIAQTKVKSLVSEYTDPTSAALIQATAALITSQVDLLIDLLISAGRLRRATP